MLANGKSTENFQNQSKFRMSILVIIPARSGSRRLKNKNKKKLHDMPLVEHTIKFAIKNIRNVPGYGDIKKYVSRATKIAFLKLNILKMIIQK